MGQRVNEFTTFVRYFFRYALYIREVLVGLMILLVLGGVTIAHLERIELGASIYFAFVTGLTIGYGDIAPETAWGRVISVMIGLIGMVFTGLTVAIATRALGDAVRHCSQDDPLDSQP